MNRLFVYILFIVSLLSLNCFGGEITLKGNYYGFNLYVMNPSVGDGFCVKEVYVNNKLTKDELRSNSFEIDFSQLDLKVGEAVTIIIRHSDGCTPKVINPNALNANTSFSYISFKADKNGNLSWSIKGSVSEEPFVVEQFRWNKWINCGEVPSAEQTQTGIYSFSPNLNTGLNMFRIVHPDNSGNPIYTKTVKYTNGKAKLVTVESTKVTNKIVFNVETMYEIFDLNGNFMLGGVGKEIDVTEIEKGKYWLNYDNKSVNFSKK
jgi:hypothetical protein